MTGIRTCWKGLAGLSALALIPILTSCQTMGTEETAIDARSIAVICETWRPVSWSSRDTPETIREVKAGNAARKAFCA